LFHLGQQVNKASNHDLIRNTAKRWLLPLLVLALSGIATTASADHSVQSPPICCESPAAPTFIFLGNSAQTDNSTLDLWVQNSSGTYYRVIARAGSGNGSTNSCLTNQGWLPAGKYGRGDGGPLSKVQHMVKTWGNTVVRGNVWFLDSKKCNGGSTVRTELFIHSNGVEGTTWDFNWKTQGCIKVSQHARNTSGFTYYARVVAWDRDNELLSVHH
jgi:hypothetical protein